MSRATLDQMIEYATTEVASQDRDKLKGLVRRMAGKWPQEKALGLAFALTSAAASFEDNLDDKEKQSTLGQAYRLAALVAADVLAIEALGNCPALCRDLLHYWRRVDPWFLNDRAQ